jgi:hypothetical protein
MTGGALVFNRDGQANFLKKRRVLRKSATFEEKCDILVKLHNLRNVPSFKITSNVIILCVAFYAISLRECAGF